MDVIVVVASSASLSEDCSSEGRPFNALDRKDEISEVILLAKQIAARIMRIARKRIQVCLDDGIDCWAVKYVIFLFIFEMYHNKSILFISDYHKRQFIS